MNLSKLLNKINYFFIKTALVAVPNIIYNSVRSFVLEKLVKMLEGVRYCVICKVSLYNNEKFCGDCGLQLYSILKQEEKQEILKNIIDYSAFNFNEREENSIFEIIFEFPLGMMPYYKSMTDEHFNKYFANNYISNNQPIPEHIKKFKNLKTVTFTLKVIPGSKNPSWKSTATNDGWISKDTLSLGMVKIYIDVEKFFDSKDQLNFIKNLETSIAHELTHFVQKYLSMMINKEENEEVSAGLSSHRSRNPNISPFGLVIDESKEYKKYLLSDLDRKKFETTKGISYSLRDIEYYPLLRDLATYDYPKIRKIIPPVLHRDLFSTFVGEQSIEEFLFKAEEAKNKNLISEEELENIFEKSNMLQEQYFMDWKQTNPEKWKSAVKEFYRVTSL